MPNEIPDSDEESDYEPAPQAANRPFEKTVEVDVADRALDINFDDFISQSQPEKDGSSQAKRSTASTQKHLQEALSTRRGSPSSGYDGADDIDGNDGDPQLPAFVTGQRKRAYSDIGDVQDQRGSSHIRTQRTKTYGASRHRPASSQDLEEPFESATMDQMVLPSAFAARSSSQAPQEQDDEENIVSRARNRPRRVISLLEDCMSNAGHVISTSNSSMGGHQSLNLDFRGTGFGLDINANPFGPLSQVSVDADMGNTMEERRVVLSNTVPLSASPRRPSRDAISPLTDAGYEPQSTTPFSASMDPSMLIFEPDDEPEMLTPPVVTTTGQVSTSMLTATLDCDLEAETVQNHIGGSTTSKKRGRNPTGSTQPSPASTQELRPDQHDEDESAIGLPIEQYRPRPSKSCGSTLEPDHPNQQGEDVEPAKKKGRKKSIKSVEKATEDSLQGKLPTSEFNLSDEALIGLPKENYKPRPSRRRSRAVVPELETSVEVGTESIASHDSRDQARQNQQSKHGEPSRTVEPSAAPTTKPKRGKKTKVKRAKTSAAGLLKKSEPMISEGEEDVVWMDTKPAKVKLDVPADLLKIVKEEDPAANAAIVDLHRASQQPDNDHAQDVKTSAAPQRTVSVVIPPRVETETVEAAKRGRKPKKSSEFIREEETDPEPHEAPATSIPATRPPVASSPPPPPPQPATTSTVLEEKDSNLALPPPLPQPQPQPASSSPSKPGRATHSPINPRGNKVLYRVGLSRKTAIPSLLKTVKKPAAPPPPLEKENVDEDGRPVDLVAETMRKWREMGALD